MLLGIQLLLRPCVIARQLISVFFSVPKAVLGAHDVLTSGTMFSLHTIPCLFLLEVQAYIQMLTAICF